MSTPPALPHCTSKGPLFVIPPERTRSHWMPDDGGYTNIVISPLDHPMLGYSMGIQRLEPGEVVPEHYHDRHEELFYIYEGSGEGVLDGQPFSFGPGYTLYFGRNVSHTITNTGTTPLSWVWVFNPPGLEYVLSGVGTPREHGSARPAEVARPAELHPVVRVITKRGRPPLPSADGHAPGTGPGRA